MNAIAVIPSEYAALLWAPLLLIGAGLVAWLWVLIAMQKLKRRQPSDSSLPKASQLEIAKTIQKAPMPHGMA